MLPWDVWGAMVPPGEAIPPAKTALFDRLSALTRDPDAHFAELRALYRDDPSIAVPSEVFSAARQRMEPV
jgi:hypothetical protein